MPSLRKRMSTYFRQLSFHNEPRQKRHNLNENSFVTKYLDGHITLKEGPAIIHGKNPTDLPNYELGKYHTGYKSIVGCYSGPNGGLTTVKRTEKHLSLLDADIDFIDTQDEIVPTLKPEQSPKRITGQPVDNTKMIIKVAGQTYCVTNKTRRHSKSQSLGSISDFNVEIERTKIDKDFYNNNSSKDCKDADISDNQGESPQNRTGINKISSDDVDAPQKFKPERLTSSKQTKNDEPKRIIKPTKSILRNPSSRTEKLDIASDKKAVKSYNLNKSKSEGNPFLHKKKGKIIKITERPKTRDSDDTENQHTSAPTVVIDDRNLPSEWNKKSDLIYGISDSLYDVNQVTKHKNGDPIADCFGIVARRDSAILAVADGVNWGEKASIAAKSAVHGCLHYLNKTIFNDTKLFENLTVQLGDAAGTSNPEAAVSLISNTREVFICLLRAFNCAHDLILENKGMLTTLTVAVVLPLQKKMKKSDSRNVYSGAKRQDMQRRASAEDSGESDQYVCCVCNVGDTLAYVYSQKYGVRELTKGSHDINCNRDMRDALGALGPVDGINPELSNLTLSITTLYKGDIVLVASDGLTDNFDPNVCRFSVNCAPDPKAKNPPPSNSTEPNRSSPTTQIPGNGNTPPQKPPRKSHIKRELERQLQAGTSPTSADDTTTVKSSPVEGRSDLKVTAFDRSTDPSISSDSKSDTHDNNSNTPVDLDPAATLEDPLIAHFMRENSVETDSRDSRSRTLDASKPAVVENRASSLRRQTSSQNKELSSKPPRNSKKSVDPGGYKFLRSKTTLDFPVTSPKTRILRNEEGMAYVTPVQRYELQLLLMEDVLTNGISGREAPCMAARKLCENLVNFTLSITSAKRHTLEDLDLYFDDRDGILVEVTGQEKKMRRKRGLEKVLNLPGKLDHVTVVACNVGNFLSSKFMNV